MALVAVLAAVVTTAHALAPARRNGPAYKIFKDHVIEMSHDNSKPGSAIVDFHSKTPLFAGGNEWREDLGSRVLGSLTALDAMNFCKQFVSVDAYSWCKHVLPVAANGSEGRAAGWPASEYTLPVVKGKEKHSGANPGSWVGLSFGTESPDAWSETMSNRYALKTKLFDCNTHFRRDLHNGNSTESPCTTRGCYDTEYEVEEVCLDDSTDKHERFEAGGRAYQPLSAALQGVERLSAFVKLDLGGAEWKTLEWLLAHDAERDKIRTLDVRLHLTKDTTPNGTVDVSSQEALRHHVEILEQLHKKMRVAGSSVELDLQSFAGKLGPRIQEPLVHTPGGLPLEEFSVSYMNPWLL